MQQKTALGLVVGNLRLAAWLALPLAVALVDLQVRAVDLGDLNIPASRVPDWYPFDETVYSQAKDWPEYDVTCSSAPCPSGKLPFTSAPSLASSCTAVSTGNFSQMDCMVDNAPSAVVLYLPPGLYEVDDNEGMTIERSNIVVRGAGHTTILRRNHQSIDAGSGQCAAARGAIANVCAPSGFGTTTSWTAHYAAGDTTVTVASVAGFSVGSWIRLDMTASTDCVHMDRGNNNGEIFTHIAKITAINGLDITMDRGLRMTYNAAGCSGFTARPFSPVENVGIENMRMTTNTSIAKGEFSGTWFTHHYGAANSWVVGVAMDRLYNRWLSTQYSARLWFQGNDFADLDTTIVHNTEGMSVRHGSVDVVWENNTCTDTRVCQKIEKGAEGVVTAYNYMDQNDADTTPYPCEISLFNHGHYTREVLMEGNDVNCTVFMNDRWWGRNGPRNTVYRNRNRSSVCRGTGTDNEAYSFVVDGAIGGGYSGIAGTYLNVIGNTGGEFTNRPIWNNPSCPPSQASVGTSLSYLIEHLWIEKNAYRQSGGRLGVGNNNNPDVGVNDYSCGTAENDACPGTNMNVTSPDPSWGGDYPTSLYHTSVPSWWCQEPETCPWSQYGVGAFGDDFGGTLCKLPAQIRYEGGTCTPIGSSPGEGQPPLPPFLLQP